MSIPPLPPPDPFMQSAEPLLWLGGGGEELRRSTEYYYDCRKRPERPHVVLQLTLAGTGFYLRNGQRQLINANQAFIDRIPDDFEYGYATESETPYRFVFTSMIGPIAEQWMERVHQTFGRVLDFGTDRSIADQLLALSSMRAQEKPIDRYQASAMLYGLFMQIHSVLMRSRLGQSPRVRQATMTIEQHACDVRFDIQQLARLLDCSREHLARQFQMATGVSPSTYLSHCRLRLAARELRTGGEKLDTIAKRCGFSGANYLCRLFRKRWGVSPAQFRDSPGMTLVP
jgi:AraC-like DNA-binding protein